MATPVANSVPLLTSVNNNNGTLNDEFISGLVQGGSWAFGGGPRVITYSFNINDAVDFNGNTIPGPGGNWTAPLIDAANRALGEWANVANITFQNISSGAYYFQSSADVALTLTGNDLLNGLGAVGLGVFPDPVVADLLRDSLGFTPATYPNPSGDVFLDNDFTGFHLYAGGYGFEVFIHEIGHALGLKHAGDDGVNFRPTFSQLGISMYDAERWTVMSTNEESPSNLAGQQVASPMPLDILAIQQIYGANMSYHSGNDVYTITPNSNNPRRTIWDAGGIDTFDASGFSQGATIDLQPGLGYVRSQLGNDGLTAIAFNVTIENATGGTGNDSILGNDAANTLNAGGGFDTLAGRAGDDIYIVDGADNILENPGEGTDTVLSSATETLNVNVENLTLTGSANINGTGNSWDNLIIGNSGNNILEGDSGNDTLAGGAGDDTYIIDAGDTVVETVGEGIDTIRSSITHSLAATPNVENITLTGGNNVHATGNSANNVLLGNSGDNVLTGGAGNDTYGVNNAGDVVIENPGEGNDTILSSLTYSLASAPNLENITLTGSNNSHATGNSGNNILLGNTGNNILTGGAGNDTYGVDAGDVVMELVGEGTDTVLSSFTYTLAFAPNVENITLTGTGNTNATGDGGGNILLGNTGINTLTGGAGNDTYGVDNAGDVVVELLGEGYDTILSSISYNLAATTNVEALNLGGTAAINGTGTVSSDALTGNANGNRLMGLGGNDTLNGGEGKDTAVYAGNRSGYTITRTGLAFSAVSGGGEGNDILISTENLQFADGMLYGNFALANVKGFADRGKSDVLWREAGGAIAVWHMDGFNVVGGGPLSLPSVEAAWRIQGTGDYNGDGKSDIVWRHDNGLIAVWTMNGLTLGEAGLTSTSVLPTEWKIQGTGDFNGDGKSDILWRHDSGLIAVWNMNGTTLLASGLTSTQQLPLEWKVSGTGDFNGDGMSDILWRHDSGLIAVWNMNGTQLLASGLTSTSSLTMDWKAAGTGDFNGDGKSDILWRHDSGLIAIWNMNGTTLEASGLTSITSLDLSWKVADTGDYNGDGKADILWRNQSGNLLMWFMDGTTVTQSGATNIGNVGTTWQIAGQPGNHSQGGNGSLPGAIAKTAGPSPLDWQTLITATTAFDATTASAIAPAQTPDDLWAATHRLLEAHLAESGDAGETSLLLVPTLMVNEESWGTTHIYAQEKQLPT